VIGRPEDTDEAQARGFADLLVKPPDEYVPLAEVTLQGERDHELAFLDVQTDLEHYRHQERILRDVGRGVPCLHSPNDVPLPLALFPLNYLANDEAPLREFTDRTDFSAEMSKALSAEVAEHDHDEARGFLRERLRSFLALRFFGLKPGPYRGAAGPDPPSSSKSPGLPFTVVTAGRFGFKVLCSGSYFLVPRQFGATLSTPVTGWLSPGRWIFGTRSSHAHSAR
jgi:hypothetical protein